MATPVIPASFSFEVFPPRTPALAESLWRTLDRLAPLVPDFVSVTCGAGGSPRDRTHAVISRIAADGALRPVPHLTAVGASRSDTDAAIASYRTLGIDRFVALRGDPPAGPGTPYAPHPGGYAGSVELVAALRRAGARSVAVSAYPEKHPESRSLAADLDLLRAKVDAGATEAITQFFFANAVFDAYRDRVAAAGIDLPLVPGILPIHDFDQMARFAARAGASVPSALAERFAAAGDPAARHALAVELAASQIADLIRRGVERFHIYTLNRAELVVDTIAALGLASVPAAPRPEPAAIVLRPLQPAPPDLRAFAADRVLVIDGAMGTMIQDRRFTEAEFRGERFAASPTDLRGNNDLLNLTRPEDIRAIHRAYAEAGADILETNTFSSTSIAQADYGLGHLAYELNFAGTRLAREAADAVATPARPRFVAGAVGPTNKTASMSPVVGDPGFRAVTFDDLRLAYREAIAGLLDGGADLLLFETITDTLNVKAGLFAAAELFEERGRRLPILVSGTITDRSGRTLSGQTPTAFWNSVRHVHPASIGLNCALGPAEMRAHVTELAKEADTLVCAYPNAGLPNELGGYDETPEAMAAMLGEFARAGLVNIVGGCCGTTPAHIAAIVAAVDGLAPRPVPTGSHRLRLSGLEPFAIAS